MLCYSFIIWFCSFGGCKIGLYVRRIESVPFFQTSRLSSYLFSNTHGLFSYPNFTNIYCFDMWVEMWFVFMFIFIFAYLLCKLPSKPNKRQLNMIIYQDEPSAQLYTKKKKKIKFEVDHVRPQTMLYDKRFSSF